FTCQVHLTQQQSKKPIASADITYVCVESSSFEKKAVPQSLREAFDAPIQPITINHAGDVL
ncbi:MAG: acyl-CoA thioesterase, partial [Paraglaciecola chathamensis]